MWIVKVIGIVVIALMTVNYMIRKTNGYKNFYRAIHVVKDISADTKYDIAVFGSTFSYYAFDLKEYNGHNFSVEPQSIYYMQKTVKHFINNINNNGTVVLALTGCIFASNSFEQEDNCTTYQSFLRPDEFNKYHRVTKCKYLLNRYIPVVNPNMIKYLFHDTKLLYSINDGISEQQAIIQAQKRISGWERVIGIENIQDFRVTESLEATMKQTTKLMGEIIDYIKQSGLRPVLLILPMSSVFNEICTRDFYNKILYKCVNELNVKGATVLDYLYDEKLSSLDLYWTSDCLNTRGRKQLSSRMMDDLRMIGGVER